MQPETQSSLFKDKILKSNPSQLTLKGFDCVKTFFESVNVSDNKMKKSGTQTVIDVVDYSSIQVSNPAVYNFLFSNVKRASKN